uniref:BLTX530 n=1 Tax=Nephila pilipes TaxID=299642 RepID=A0A076KV17_NEPPI|nr:BLTX530 [Nephila pilipes]
MSIYSLLVKKSLFF